MARVERKISEGDVYHVIVRGVGKQIIFEDTRDRRVFLNMLSKSFSSLEVKVYAWCLMSNHVHLLLCAPLERISRAMLKLESGYARYFNETHDRVGTLFQGRFTSVPIEDDEQLLTAVRYIHLNPVKAGESAETCWSSYGEYIGTRSVSYCDCSFVLEIAGDVEQLKGLQDEAAEYSRGIPHGRFKEDEALAVAKRVLSGVNPYDLRSMGRAERDSYLVKLREAGLSASQIGRITSIGRNIIYRAKG